MAYLPVHRLPFVDVDVLERSCEVFDVGFLELARRHPGGHLGLGEDLVGGVEPHAFEGTSKELTQRRASLCSSISTSVSRENAMNDRRPVGQTDLDLERVAAVDGRRTGGGGVKLARHDLVQPFEDQFFADRADAIGGGDGSRTAWSDL